MIINGEELKQMRIERGLTLQDVAARLGISESTISRYETGQIKRVSPKVITGYSKLFHVPINSLYENAQTEWVQALEEAGLHDPRVAGFIDYLEEQAQKEASEEFQITPKEAKIILAYRNADERNKQMIEYFLGVTDLIVSKDSNPNDTDVDLLPKSKE